MVSIGVFFSFLFFRQIIDCVLSPDSKMALAKELNVWRHYLTSLSIFYLQYLCIV